MSAYLHALPLPALESARGLRLEACSILAALERVAGSGSPTFVHRNVPFRLIWAFLSYRTPTHTCLDMHPLSQSYKHDDHSERSTSPDTAATVNPTYPQPLDVESLQRRRELRKNRLSVLIIHKSDSHATRWLLCSLLLFVCLVATGTFVSSWSRNRKD